MLVAGFASQVFLREPVADWQQEAMMLRGGGGGGGAGGGTRAGAGGVWQRGTARPDGSGGGNVGGGSGGGELAASEGGEEDGSRVLAARLARSRVSGGNRASPPLFLLTLYSIQSSELERKRLAMPWSDSLLRCAIVAKETSPRKRG